MKQKYPGTGRTKRKLQALGLVWLLLVFPFSWPGQEVRTWGRYMQTPAGSPGEAKAPRIALTFDDGPSAEYTQTLLDGLEERGVKAAFFVIGANIEKDGNEELIRRMHEEGHLIGNHTYHHINLGGMSRKEAEKELELTDRLVRELTGEETFLVRPPFGEFPEGEETDKLYVKWTLDSRDWVTKNTGEIVRKVVTDVKENDIILMHDCYETSVEAAVQIIDILQEEEYEFVRLDELLMD